MEIGFAYYKSEESVIISLHQLFPRYNSEQNCSIYHWCYQRFYEGDLLSVEINTLPEMKTILDLLVKLNSFYLVPPLNAILSTGVMSELTGKLVPQISVLLVLFQNLYLTEQ